MMKLFAVALAVVTLINTATAQGLPAFAEAARTGRLQITKGITPEGNCHYFPIVSFSLAADSTPTFVGEWEIADRKFTYTFSGKLMDGGRVSGSWSSTFLGMEGCWELNLATGKGRWNRKRFAFVNPSDSVNQWQGLTLTITDTPGNGMHPCPSVFPLAKPHPVVSWENLSSVELWIFHAGAIRTLAVTSVAFSEGRYYVLVEEEGEKSKLLILTSPNLHGGVTLEVEGTTLVLSTLEAVEGNFLAHILSQRGERLAGLFLVRFMLK